MSEMENSMGRIKITKAEVKRKIDREIEHLFAERMENIKLINRKEAFELFCEIEAMELCLFRRECKNNPELMSYFCKEMNADTLDRYVISAFRDVFYEMDREKTAKQRDISVSQKIIAFCVGSIYGAIGGATLFFYFSERY